MKKFLRIFLTSFLILSVLMVAAACTNPQDGSTGSTPSQSDPAASSSSDPGAWHGCTLILQTQEGNPIADVELVIGLDGETVFTATTDAEGKVHTQLKPGTYSVTCLGLPMYHLATTEVLEITEGDQTKVIEVYDNTPNGSQERPYRLSEGATPLTIPAGATYHYYLNAVTKIIITLQGADVEVVYTTKGENDQDVEHVYTPDANGVITFEAYTGDPNTPARFTVTNKSAEEQTGSITTALPLGSSNNPFVVESIGKAENADVEKGGTVYYLWTVVKDGYLCVGSDSAVSNISMQNLSNSVVTSNTEGAGAVLLAVKAGQEVRIMVSTIDGEAAQIPFTINEYAGTESDPVVVSSQKLTMSCKAGETIYFQVAQANKTLVMSQTNVEVTVNGETYTVTDTASGTIALGDKENNIFAIKNPGSSTKDITFTLS